MNQSPTNGASACLAELEEARRRIKAVIAVPDDDPATIAAKHEFVARGVDAVVNTAKEALRARAVATRTGVFDGPAEPIEGQARAKILIGDQIVRLPGAGGVDLALLRPGQYVEISPGDPAVIVAADPVPPRGGDVLNVVSVGPGGEAERSVDVEESVGDRRHRVRVSGFLDGSPVEVGDSVRVVGGFVYEIVKNTATKRAEFLEEVRYVPDGRTRFEDIKGQDEAVAEIELVLDRLIEPERYPGSELLGNMTKAVFGPPGNGKTMAFAAAANALVERVGADKVRVYYVRAGALKNKYVGNSEANTRAIFEQAVRDYRERGIRSLICFEEAESTMTSRDMFDNTGVSQGITATLLTYLGGAVPLTGVLVLVLSNHESMFDFALLRPERLGGANRIQMGRLRPPAVREIVGAHLSNGTSKLTAGVPIDSYLEAIDAALEISYGNAIVGNQKVEVRGRHLTSGAAATGAVKAGITRLHRHLFLTAKNGHDTPFRSLTPALLFHGARQTLSSVMASHSGEGSTFRARELFAGDLVRPEEAKTLTEVRALPADSLCTPELYDLAAMVDLEQGDPR